MTDMTLNSRRSQVGRRVLRGRPAADGRHYLTSAARVYLGRWQAHHRRAGSAINMPSALPRQAATVQKGAVMEGYLDAV
jgi:hypothetical protein